jgi:acetoin utilization deacetylase AcuC-like enzyme
MVNVPLPAGSGTREIRTMLDEIWIPTLQAFRPQLMLVSAGFDAHRDDPLAGLAWTEEDYGYITDALVAVADTFCPGRIVSSLEGGYNLDALGRCVAAHISSLLAPQPQSPL